MGESIEPLACGNFAHEAFFAGFSILTVLLNSLGSLEMQDSIKCGRPRGHKQVSVGALNVVVFRVWFKSNRLKESKLISRQHIAKNLDTTGNVSSNRRQLQAIFSSTAHEKLLQRSCK